MKLWAAVVVMWLLLIVSFFWFGAAYGQQLVKYYKTVNLGQYSVGIVCLNGGDPTGTKSGNVLIISCGKQ